MTWKWVFCKEVITKTKIVLIIGVVLVVVAAGGYVVVSDMPKGHNEKDIAYNKAKEVFKVSEIVVYEIDNSPLNKIFPEIHLYRAVGKPTDYPYPYNIIISVNNKKQSFLIPDELDKLIEKENLIVEDKNTAMNIAVAYIWAKDIDAIVLQTISDIPWTKRPENAKDPSLFNNTVKAPVISELEKEYQIEIYSWHPINGILKKWMINIEKNGSFRIYEELIGSNVGDYKKEILY